MKLASGKLPFIITIVILNLLVFHSHAQSTDDSLSDSRDLKSIEEADSKKFMSGDWGGVRARLIELGIIPTARYYASILGNPVGGERKGVQYAGLLNAFLNFDLEKLLNINGTRIVISGSWASGRSLTNRDIENLFNVSSVFSGQSVRLYQMFLRSDLIQKRLNFALGRMAVGDKFATSSIFYNYLSLAFNENPVSISFNDPGFLSNPQASWGSWVRVAPIEQVYIMTGVYNSNPDLSRDSAHGVDFSFRDGALLIGEVGYLHNQKEDSANMPGTYKLGAYYDTADFTFLDSSDQKEDGNYGLYAIGEQMIYSESDDFDQGLRSWAALTLAPDEEINTFPFYLSGGLVYKGLFESRDSDKGALGFAYGKISDDFRGKDFEMLFELTYIIQTTKWLQIQPDLQYIVHPGGSGDIPNALVIGFQLSADI